MAATRSVALGFLPLSGSWWPAVSSGHWPRWTRRCLRPWGGHGGRKAGAPVGPLGPLGLLRPGRSQVPVFRPLRPVGNRGLEQRACPGHRASTSPKGEASHSGGPEAGGRGAVRGRLCPDAAWGRFLLRPAASRGSPAPISHVGKLRPGVVAEAWLGSGVTHRTHRRPGLQGLTDWPRKQHDAGHRSQVIRNTKWRLEEKCRSIPAPTPSGLRRRCGRPAHNSFAYTKMNAFPWL